LRCCNKYVIVHVFVAASPSIVEKKVSVIPVRIVLVPVLFFVDVLMWIFRASDRQVENFARCVDRFEDMLDHCYPRGLVPVASTITIAGYGTQWLFGNELPPHGQMNFAGGVEFASVYCLAILGLCLFAAIATLYEYCENHGYQPTNNMYGIWLMFFLAAVATESFAFGYFILPSLI